MCNWKGIEYVYVTGKSLVTVPLFYLAKQWNSKVTAHENIDWIYLVHFTLGSICLINSCSRNSQSYTIINICKIIYSVTIIQNCKNLMWVFHTNNRQINSSLVWHNVEHIDPWYLVFILLQIMISVPCSICSQ